MVKDISFDELIAHFYKSASGGQPWGVALECLRSLMSAQVVTFHGLIKSSMTVAFSFEVGNMPPQAALDFIRHYHQIEPRTVLLLSEPVGHVISCHRHFSDAFVAADPYHQEFLIPYGLRYCTAIKAYEDDDKVVICGVHRGVGMPPLSVDEEAVVRRLGVHLDQALTMYFKLRSLAGPAFIGLETLSRLPYPILLLDESRRLVYQNDLARALIARSTLVCCTQGLLCGPDAHGDAQLLLALRTLGLASGAYLGQDSTPMSDKAFVRLQNSKGDWLGVHAHALRSAESMGAFGEKDLALVLLHEPGGQLEPDPFVVASMWDLNPAEAQVMVGLGRGLTAQELATQRGVSLATIRSQIQAAMAKTGATRQAELVSLLSSMPPVLT
jgi:DNA-binding CsgD family transcriptional regulator